MHLTLALLTLLTAHSVSAEEKKPTPPKPCTVRSTTTGSFFDLSSLKLVSPQDSKDKLTTPANSWLVKGYDYGANFSMNICGPVVEALEDVVGVKEGLWQNISAYYQKDGKTFSMGYVALLLI
jgi:cation-dependent mannose-6-phosphate receptor